MTQVLFIGGPDDGERRDIVNAPVRQGAILRTFLDRPCSDETAAAIVNGDIGAINRHAALDAFHYRCVQFQCEGLTTFVAIDDAEPDESALAKLIAGYNPQTRKENTR